MPTLILPVPPSPNRWPSHHMMLHRMKRNYQARVWVSAIEQAPPLNEPPFPANVDVTLWLKRFRDEDNLHASLKWLLDALKQKQKGSLAWRKGLYTSKGYIRDDDPDCIKLAVFQIIGTPRCQVRITPRGG